MHDPAQPADLLMGLLVSGLAVIAVTTLGVMARSRAREDFLAGPRLDEWKRARRQLHRADQRRVIRATRRNHPASRAALADAQLAYVRYLQDGARRDSGAPWWRRAVPLVGSLVPGGFAVWSAVNSTGMHERMIQCALAAWFAINASLWVLTVRRAETRLADRVARLETLETVIEDRHACWPGAAGTPGL